MLFCQFLVLKTWCGSHSLYFLLRIKPGRITGVFIMVYSVHFLKVTQLCFYKIIHFPAINLCKVSCNINLLHYLPVYHCMYISPGGGRYIRVILQGGKLMCYRCWYWSFCWVNSMVLGSFSAARHSRRQLKQCKLSSTSLSPLRHLVGYLTQRLPHFNPAAGLSAA